MDGTRGLASRAIHSVWSRDRDIFPDSFPSIRPSSSSRSKQKGGTRASASTNGAMRYTTARYALYIVGISENFIFFERTTLEYFDIFKLVWYFPDNSSNVSVLDGCWRCEHGFETIVRSRWYLRLSYKTVVSWTRGEGGCRANYKQEIAKHVRGGAKTKDKGLLRDDKRINSSVSWEARECELRCRDSVASVVERELNPWWRELQINYLVVLIIILYRD